MCYHRLVKGVYQWQGASMVNYCTEMVIEMQVYRQVKIGGRQSKVIRKRLNNG